MKLPGAVTLAFTPYGADPTKLAERARAQRHEILLQVPMEPFDYPDNDPDRRRCCPLGAEQISTGCTGISAASRAMPGRQFHGRALVVSDNVMQPVVREAAKRGLGYFDDDGSAPRSVASSLAASQQCRLPGPTSPSTRCRPRSRSTALAKLETIARERGSAVGIASALPISIERLAAWSKALEGRGIMLVPLTTAMLKSKSG